MKYELILRKGAEKDIAEAFRWYEEKVSGLGSEYIFSVDRVMDSIQRNPERYPVIYESARRALLHRFPYSVFFVWEQKRISVLAVMHTARNPAKWRKP